MDNNREISILFASAECLPFCANGGVSDMCFALSKYLNRNPNVDVRVIMPLYSKISDEYKSKFELIGEKNITLAWRNAYCGIYTYLFHNIRFYFLDNKQYFDRENMFGYPDDVERFTFFSKAVLDILPVINFYPDIIHANDWQSGMICSFLKILAWQNPKYEHIKTVMNIHNLIYQGKSNFSIVKDLLDIEDKFAYLFDYYGEANIMKASILCSDKVVAVSESYKNEILNTDHGYGLQEVLQSISYKLVGIVNGIDYEFYNPETDPNIFVNFGEKTIDKRKINKLEFQKYLGLEVNEDIPMYAYVGLFASHKGLDLLSGVLEKYILEKNIQFVTIGGGNTEYETYLENLAKKYPNNVRLKIGYDSKFVKKIYASSDFLFNVSSIEPCGLCPMIANRYGCLPIVTYTGGLKDNFTDFKNNNGNGYILKNYNKESLCDLIDRTLSDFTNKEKINKYILSGLRKNFDAKDCADKYLKLYYEM